MLYIIQKNSLIFVVNLIFITFASAPAEILMVDNVSGGGLVVKTADLKSVNVGSNPIRSTNSMFVYPIHIDNLYVDGVKWFIFYFDIFELL